MTPVTLEGFLSKKQIEASYGRSYRSLTRDITRAVKTGNADILRHLKLVTEDDQVREGTEVTLELIQDLSNHGLRPTWLAEESWVAEWCAHRRLGPRRQDEAPKDEPSNQAGPVPVTPPSTLDSGAAVPPPSPATVEMLQQRIDDQRQQIDLLRGQLQIKDEQIRTANQLAGESQQLMRDLHVLLKNVQDGLLGEGTGRLIPARTAATEGPRSTSPHLVETGGPPPDRSQNRIPADHMSEHHERPLVHAPAAARPGATGTSRKRTRGGPRPARETKRTTRKRPPQPATQSKPAVAHDQEPPTSIVGKYLPTLDRAFRSFFRR